MRLIVLVLVVFALKLQALQEKSRIHRRLPPPPMRRAIRKNAGITQSDVAAALGVDRVTVARWERGERTPRGALLRAYVKLLESL